MVIVVIIIFGLIFGSYMILRKKNPEEPKEPSNLDGEPAKQIASETWNCSECETENDGLWKLCTDCGVKK